MSGQFQATADLWLEKEPLASTEQGDAKTSLERRKITCPHRESNQVTIARMQNMKPRLNPKGQPVNAV
jgi:hypothetical protein